MKGNNLLDGKYFGEFFIHKEVFALKADCANLFKLIKILLIEKYFVGLTCTNPLG